MNSVQVRESRIGILPIEIIEYIWKLNYLWAISIVQKATKLFISRKVLFLDQMHRFCIFNCRFTGGFVNYKIHYRNRLLGAKEILNTLNSCKCCSRHQENKPRELKLWTETPFHGSQNTLCSCSCRHMARFICREIEVEE